ncbi:MAG: class I SAM-dependent methyltransferase [Acidimicrobiales bacterium]|nr:class I SAM-dependent methyltransferase [Acidimicrobiales bacterium]
MRPAVIEFARDVAAAFPVHDPLVEVGARAAAGQEAEADLRAIFGASQHIGCDLQPGTGVDRIEDVHQMSFADESVGTVICLETLEHVADPLRAVAEMHRILRPGGVLAISSLMFFPIHEHPWDYWRFTPEGFELLLRPFESSLVVAQGWDLMPEGVFGVGVKGAVTLTPDLLPRTRRIAESWGVGQRVDLGPMRMSVRELWRFTLGETRAALRDRVRSG